MNNYRVILTYESGNSTDIECDREKFLSIYNSFELLSGVTRMQCFENNKFICEKRLVNSFIDVESNNGLYSIKLNKDDLSSIIKCLSKNIKDTNILNNITRGDITQVESKLLELAKLANLHNRLSSIANKGKDNLSYVYEKKYSPLYRI